MYVRMYNFYIFYECLVKRDKVDAIIALSGRFNDATLVTRWSASIIKVNGCMHSDTF